MIKILKSLFSIFGKEKRSHIKKRKEKQKGKNKIDPTDKSHHNITQSVNKTSLWIIPCHQ